MTGTPSTDRARTRARQMTTVQLVGSYSGDERRALNALYRGLAAPWWSGFNLDAAWDLLTGVIPGPISVVWQDCAAQPRLAALLREAAAERDDLTVQFIASAGGASDPQPERSSC